VGCAEGVEDRGYFTNALGGKKVGVPERNQK